MAVLVYINGSTVLRIETDLETMKNAYETALEKNATLKVTTKDGKERVVNPSQISYFEEEDDPQATIHPGGKPGKPSVPA